MYVAGTHHPMDGIDDLMLPMHLVRRTHRYNQVMHAFDAAIAKGYVIDHVVGHSLGAAVTLAVAKDTGSTYELYANPGYGQEPILAAHNHREEFDPISHFDSSATTTSRTSLNPHAFQTQAAFRYSRGTWTDDEIRAIGARPKASGIRRR